MPRRKGLGGAAWPVHLPRMSRIAIAVPVGLLGFFLYVGLVLKAADHVLNGTGLLQVPFFVVAGIAVHFGENGRCSVPPASAERPGTGKPTTPQGKSPASDAGGGFRRCRLGRSERIRTSGPCVPNTVLYQAELRSVGRVTVPRRRVPRGSGDIPSVARLGKRRRVRSGGMAGIRGRGGRSRAERRRHIRRHRHRAGGIRGRRSRRRSALPPAATKGRAPAVDAQDHRLVVQAELPPGDDLDRLVDRCRARRRGR